MKTPTNFQSNALIAMGLLLITVLVGCGCDGPSDVQSTTVVRSSDLPATIDPGPQPQSKVIIKVQFNVDIDASNLAAPGNFNISAKGDDAGHEDNDIPGSVQYVSSTRSAYFISTNSLGFSPNAGENVTYTVQIIGIGDNCVKRQSGECIDGCDDDTAPGNNHVEKITVVG